MVRKEDIKDDSLEIIFLENSEGRHVKFKQGVRNLMLYKDYFLVL